MPEKKMLRLTCPVCEKNLRVAEGIERFACLNCGTELNLEREGDLLKLVPTLDTAARMTDSQQQLIEVNSALKSADDVYGVGCAIATMGITLAACIILALAIVVQSQVLFWAALAVALVLLGFVLFMFLTASSRGTGPLLRKRDVLQAQVEAESDPGDSAETEVAEDVVEDAGDQPETEVELPVEPPVSQTITQPNVPPVNESIKDPVEPTFNKTVEKSAEPPVPTRPEQKEALG